MRIGALLGITVGLAACAEPPTSITAARMLGQQASASAAVVSTKLTRNYSRMLQVSCANDGLGEMVALSGQIEIQTHSSEDANGGVHLMTLVRPSHVVGVGLTSGLFYRGTGATFENESYAADGYPAVLSSVNNFRIIGQGPGNNLLVHMTVHQTMNADGELTVDVDLSSQECK